MMQRYIFDMVMFVYSHPSSYANVQLDMCAHFEIVYIHVNHKKYNI